MNPRAALTTYSLSRGAPSASLGTSPNCPRVVILPDNSLHTFVFFIRLFRCFLIEKPCVLYRISKLFVKCFFKFFPRLFYQPDKRREWDSNPRALADKRFSRPPRYDHFDISPYFRRFSLSAQVIFYHLISELSTTNLIFFYFFILTFFQIAKMPLQSKDLPV